MPTLIEVKRSSDTRIRREVVGQMLDYAANGAEFWGLEKIRAAFESRYQDADAASRALAEFFPAAEEPERYWERVGVNLRAGKLRLMFVADVIPAELRRVVELLNEQLERTEVLALESASMSKREVTASRSCRGSSAVRRPHARRRARAPRGHGGGGPKPNCSTRSERRTDPR